MRLSLFGCALLAALAAALALTSSASAFGGTTTCDGFLPPGLYGTVVVPEGASCFSDGPVGITGGVDVLAGASFFLGNDEGTARNGWISNGVHATNPSSMEIHFTTINGGVDIHGGSGPFTQFDVTFIAIEDNIISGGATVEGYDGFWFGFIRNHVWGDVNLNDNVLGDPDGNEYVTNTIHGDLNCSGNDPAPQAGDSEGSPNVVFGSKTGQCAAPGL